MAKLVWTVESERWLKDIFDYIAQDDPAAAESVVRGIYERAQQLLQFPESGYKYEGTTRDVRILLYGHYRIACVVADKEIVVLGVFRRPRHREVPDLNTSNLTKRCTSHLTQFALRCRCRRSASSAGELRRYKAGPVESI